MPAEMLIDLSTIDLTRMVFDKAAIEARLPHRHEMLLLDGIVWFDHQTLDAIGFHDLKADAFWVRGHIPGMPIFPGALMVECAAQLSSFCYRERFSASDGRFFGFGGIDKVRFRGMVTPGQRLYLICRAIVLNRRHSRFAVQGIAGNKLAFEGEIIGVSMPMAGTKSSAIEAGGS
jgi:3-hydroxyacyl-[acyl-carrier-protein] dehydratase